MKEIPHLLAARRAAAGTIGSALHHEMLPTFSSPDTHQEQRLGEIERLHPGLYVCAENNCLLWGIEVEVEEVMASVSCEVGIKEGRSFRYGHLYI